MSAPGKAAASHLAGRSDTQLPGPRLKFGRTGKGLCPFNSFLPREELRETPLMDAVIKKIMPQSAYMEKPTTDRPTEAEVEAAVHTLLRWTGDDTSREGLVDTPKRVAKAFREMFNGYD